MFIFFLYHIEVKGSFFLFLHFSFHQFITHSGSNLLLSIASDLLYSKVGRGEVVAGKLKVRCLRKVSRSMHAKKDAGQCCSDDARRGEQKRKRETDRCRGAMGERSLRATPTWFPTFPQRSHNTANVALRLMNHTNFFYLNFYKIALDFITYLITSICYTTLSPSSS